MGINDKEEKGGDGLSLNFTSRAVELLETGVAHHMDTLQQQLIVEEEDGQTKLNYAFVPYPEFLLLPSHNNQETQPSIMATTKIWKRILHPHDIPVVHKLLQLLSKCSRDIMWKHEMSMEIRRIAKEENKWREERTYRKELKIWRREKRPDELAKLYEVRETFELKLEMLREKHNGYVKEREERVERELLRRKEKGIGSGGISGLDWDGEITFAFNDDKGDEDDDVQERNGVQEDSSSIESGYHESGGEDFGSNYDDGYDCDDDGYDVSDEDENKQISDQTQVISNDSTLERKNRRAKAASKRLRRKLEAEREKAKAANLLSKVKAAHEEEDHVRQMCMSTDEKLAMVMVTNMEKRMERIDDLLDSLQMDAWKDEEEGLLESDSSDNEDDSDMADNDNDMTLLDNILAMILGALPPPKSTSSQEHFNFLKEEHKSIVDEWKLIFGRLPKLGNEHSTDKNTKPDTKISNNNWSDSDDNSTQNETMQRKPFKMNLVDSIPDDWEENEADCDDFIFSAFEAKDQSGKILDQAESLEPKSKTKDSFTVNKGKVGLRPGGKILY